MSDELQVVTVAGEQPVAAPVVSREVVIVPSEQAVLVETPQSSVIEVEHGTSIVDEVPEVTVLTVGEIGPRGVQGLPGSAVSTVTRVAAVAIGGHRVVVLDSNEKAIYADNTIASHVYKVLGVTTGAAAQDAAATIQTFGELEEVSFNWTLNQEVYLTTNGQMTQTAPATGFSRVIGFPMAPTKLFIDLSTPVVLAA